MPSSEEARTLRPSLGTLAAALALASGAGCGPGHGVGTPVVERVLLVGHEPDMSGLLGDLLGSPLPVVFKKGGLCRIDFAGHPLPGRGTLVFHLMPRILRLLGS